MKPSPVPPPPLAETLAERLAAIKKNMREAQQLSPLATAAPRLIAVSKQQSDKRIEEALVAGLRVFGENKLQDAQARWAGRREIYPDLQLHFIGPLQTNKVAEVVTLFDAIHSVDRPKLARKLADEMQRQGKSPDCYMQINTGEEDQKAGILPAQVETFMKQCREAYKLPVVGLMCIPPQGINPAPHFAFLRKLAGTYGLSRLSMGMSDDYPTAIRLGATDIRVGSALFGPRS